MTQQGQAFAESRVLSMFPTCVWVHDLQPADIETVNGQILPVIREELAQLSDTFNDISERSGLADPRWSLSAPWLDYDNDGFASLATRGVLDFLKIDYREFQITGCWANVNPQGSSHRVHHHPNNYLAGVYYAQAPDERDGLLFHEPRAQALVLSPKFKQVTELTNSEAKIGVRTGRLLVFPAWLDHSVPKTQGAGERISVSFNVMLSNFAEEFSPPKW